jgi:hypothetical protein
MSSGFEQCVGIGQPFDRQGLEFESIHPRHQDIALRYSIPMAPRRQPRQAGALARIEEAQAQAGKFVVPPKRFPIRPLE